jgi:flagellar protein FlaG
MKIAGADLAAPISRRTQMEIKPKDFTVSPTGDKNKPLAALWEEQRETPKIAEQELAKVIEKANKALQGPKTGFRFSVHEGTQEILVKVINEDTGEVIREIPPEKILDMVAKMWELMGIFVDEKR